VKLSRKIKEDKHRFGLIKGQQIGRHPLRDKINCDEDMIKFKKILNTLALYLCSPLNNVIPEGAIKVLKNLNYEKISCT